MLAALIFGVPSAGIAFWRGLAAVGQHKAMSL
jgi:hypothetical protein